MMNHRRLTCLIGAIALVVCSACDPKAASINSGTTDAASLLDASEPDSTGGTSAGGSGSMGDATVPPSALTDARDAGDVPDAGDLSAPDRPFYYCQGLSEQACAQDPACHPLMGVRLYADAGCLREEFAGCLPVQDTCGALITYAVAPDGTCWSFGSTCMTDGAVGSVDYTPTHTYDAGACNGVQAAPLCN
jgi:hypothetical protein